MRHSDTLGALAKALAAVQAEMKPAAMNAINPFLKNRYADLGSVIEASREALTRHGLAVSQMLGGEPGTVSVETIILHESGEWMASTATLPVPDERGKSAAQAAGSVVTYLRRYGMAAALGIYADEDTDGHVPQEAPAPRQRPREAPQAADVAPPAPMSETTRKRLFATFTERGITDADQQRAGMSRVLGREVASRGDITEAEARAVLASLKGAPA